MWAGCRMWVRRRRRGQRGGSTGHVPAARRAPGTRGARSTVVCRLLPCVVWHAAAHVCGACVRSVNMELMAISLVSLAFQFMDGMLHRNAIVVQPPPARVARRRGVGARPRCCVWSLPCNRKSWSKKEKKKHLGMGTNACMNVLCNCMYSCMPGAGGRGARRGRGGAHTTTRVPPSSVDVSYNTHAERLRRAGCCSAVSPHSWRAHPTLRAFPVGRVTQILPSTLHSRKGTRHGRAPHALACDFFLHISADSSRILPPRRPPAPPPTPNPKKTPAGTHTPR